MGDIDVGGDGSVKWNVNVGQLRENSAISRGAGGGPPGGHGKGQHHQEGIDEASPSVGFKVSIKVPVDATAKTNLAKDLATALVTINGAAPARHVEFTFPIEPDTADQIKVHW